MSPVVFDGMKLLGAQQGTLIAEHSQQAG